MAKWDADKLARLLELAERERRIYERKGDNGEKA
jgi:hypothetical protein